MAVAVLLAACGGDDDESSVTTTVPVGPTGTRTTATAAVPFDGATTPVSTPPAGEKHDLKAVRVGAHEGFNRVVFEFDGGVPGYSVKYVERPIIADGSGDEVTVGGGAVLEVRLEPAMGADVSRRIAGTDEIVEVVKTGDFEAVVHFAVGVRDRAPFKVITSEGTTLIVDIER